MSNVCHSVHCDENQSLVWSPFGKAANIAVGFSAVERGFIHMHLYLENVFIDLGFVFIACIRNFLFFLHFYIFTISRQDILQAANNFL